MLRGFLQLSFTVLTIMGSSDSCLGDNMGGVKGSAGLGGGAFGEDGGVATS